MTEHSKETVRFVEPLRAQINTTKSKACTYFAKDLANGGRRVFVKGPYKSKENANLAPKVARFKKAAAPHLRVVEVSLVEMVADGMRDCQLGVRNQIAKDSVMWFQVAEDILTRETTLPKMLKCSKRAWVIPVEVVDWSKVSQYKHVHYSNEWDKSIYAVDPAAADHLVSHVILSWICGCGADLAFSNFIYDPLDHVVWQVDCEAWCKSWMLSDTQIVSSRTKSAEFFSRYVKSDIGKWTAFIDEIHCRLDAVKSAIADSTQDQVSGIVGKIELLHSDIRHLFEQIAPHDKSLKRPRGLQLESRSNKTKA